MTLTNMNAGKGWWQALISNLTTLNNNDLSATVKTKIGGIALNGWNATADTFSGKSNGHKIFAASIWCSKSAEALAPWQDTQIVRLPVDMVSGTTTVVAMAKPVGQTDVVSLDPSIDTSTGTIHIRNITNGKNAVQDAIFIYLIALA